MDFFPDLTKPLFEKNAFELATEAWLFDEMTSDDRDTDLLDDFEDDLFSENLADDDLLGDDLGLDEDDW